MYRLIVALMIILPIHVAHSQEDQIRAVVDKMFQSMYDGDTAALRSCFIPAAQLMTYAHDAKGNPRAKAETINDFIRGVSMIGDAVFEERFLSWQCLIDDGIASVWTPYEFYFEDKFSHCGVNSFQLIKVQDAWKISMITDTRRKNNCPVANAGMVIDSMLNRWHHAAAIADEDVFFGSMTADAIYIGTDASERWLRDELAAWSKKYFDKESAWAFTPLSRTIRFGPGGQIAWFDELLDTWMGVCRSTGIVVMHNNEWKITHYQLSVTLPNDKLDGFKKLIGKS